MPVGILAPKRHTSTTQAHCCDSTTRSTGPVPVEVRGAALEKAPQIFERQRQRVLGLGIAALAAQ